MWAGLTADAADTLAALFEDELARPAFVSRLLYQRCDGVPELPLLGSVPLTSKQWMPAVLKRGPLPELTAEQKRAAVEALLEAIAGDARRSADTLTWDGGGRETSASLTFPRA